MITTHAQIGGIRLDVILSSVKVDIIYVRPMSNISANCYYWTHTHTHRKVYKGVIPLYIMEINGHEEVTGEEIDWACDTRDELTSCQEDLILAREDE